MDLSFVRTIYLESRLTALDNDRSANLPPTVKWYTISRGPYKLYRRGPDAVGASLVIPDKLAALVRHLWNQGDRQIFMAGFSRGGAIVINTASLLNDLKSPIEVEALFLFDAVDRLFFLKAQRIPENVRHCYHAIRAKAAGSREQFGNCGMKLESQNTVLLEKSDFYTTHGGMGGLGYGDRTLSAAQDPGGILTSGIGPRSPGRVPKNDWPRVSSWRASPMDQPRLPRPKKWLANYEF
jgi:pimeloyl-ACP methyl ester carboxylesterase